LFLKISHAGSIFQQLTIDVPVINPKTRHSGGGGSP